MEFDNAPSSYKPLRRLSIAENVNVAWDFFYGIDVLDRNRIYINLKCSKKKKRLLLCFFIYLRRHFCQ